jgi:hypothetical protein
MLIILLTFVPFNLSYLKKNQVKKTMFIQICHHDSQGLANDAHVLSKMLSNHGSVSVLKYPEEVLYTNQTLPYETDVRIFLEHASMSMMSNAKQNVLIPNVEMMNARDIQCAPHMDLLVAKTQYAYDVLRNKFSDKKVVYWGWTSIDRGLANGDTGSQDYNAFLHVKGVSRFKNTQLVLDTWLKHPEWPTLTVVHHGNPNLNGYVDIPVDQFAVAKNVRMIQRKVSDSELTDLMNRCGVHVCPSNMEGFGHYINEALSSRALVVTTDGHPMKQFVRDGHNGFLIPPVEQKPHALGTHYTLDTRGFEQAILRILETPIESRVVMGRRSRKMYQMLQLKPIPFV